MKSILKGIGIAWLVALLIALFSIAVIVVINFTGPLSPFIAACILITAIGAFSGYIER